MYQVSPQVGFKFLEQLTQSFAEMVFNTLDYNLKQLEAFQEGLNGVTEQISVVHFNPAQLSPPTTLDEVAVLRQQVQLLTQRINDLENAHQIN